MFYLHYEDSSSMWIISDTYINDITGVAQCEADKDSLQDCTYGMWSVTTNTGDYTQFKADESMGYDRDCNIVSTTMDCNSGECASWELWVGIENEDVNMEICTDDFISCVTESFLGEWSSVSDYNKLCHSEYDIALKMNVTFTGYLGYTVYTEFLTDYSTIINECADSGVELSSDIAVSKLRICDDCEAFASAIGEGEESGNIKHGLSVLSLIVSFFAIMF